MTWAEVALASQAEVQQSRKEQYKEEEEEGMMGCKLDWGPVSLPGITQGQPAPVGRPERQCAAVQIHSMEIAGFAVRHREGEGEEEGQKVLGQPS